MLKLVLWDEARLAPTGFPLRGYSACRVKTIIICLLRPFSIRENISF